MEVRNISRPIIELKGYHDGLYLIIDPVAPMKQIVPAIEERMTNLGDSLAGMSLDIDVGNRPLSEQQLGRLRTILHGSYGLEINRIINASGRSSQVAERPPISSAPALRLEERLRYDNFLAEKEKTQLIRNTLRSGQVERFLEGNVVILGDVNPGAEVTAAGDIVVVGTLRGIAHAGALGNVSSVVVALNLIPTQLRIGRFITRPPAEKQRSRSRPEIARIKGEDIIVEQYDGKFDGKYNGL
jgi:septum site-determining protein MinC